MHRIVAIAMTVVVSTAGAVQTMYPLPSGATNVGHVALEPGTIEQDHFLVAEKYPGSSAMDHYGKVFSKWRSCYWNDRGWYSFGDASGEKPQFVHQLVRHWVSPRNDVAVTVLIRYTSTGLTYRAAPDNERQSVVVLRRKSKNAEKELGEIGATCDKRT